MAKGGIIIFLVYLIVALYLVNSAFSFVTLPEFIQSVDKWIMVVAAALVVIGGAKYLLSASKKAVAQKMQ